MLPRTAALQTAFMMVHGGGGKKSQCFIQFEKTAFLEFNEVLSFTSDKPKAVGVGFPACCFNESERARVSTTHV